jgi:hypothetical protein
MAKEKEIRKTGSYNHSARSIVSGNGPQEMKDKLDTQEVVKLMRGEKYFYSPKEKGW